MKLRDPLVEAHDRKIAAIAEHLHRGVAALEPSPDLGPVVDLVEVLRAAAVVTARSTSSTVRAHGIPYALKVSTPVLRVWVAEARAWARAWKVARHIRYELHILGHHPCQISDGTTEPRWVEVSACVVPPDLLEAAWRDLLAARAAHSPAA